MPLPDLQLRVAASAYPISRTEAKAHCKVDHTAEDTYIDGLIAAATAHVESMTGLALIESEWSAWFAEWPCDGKLIIPKAPLASVEEINYTERTGTETTWASTDYEVDTKAMPGVVALAWGKSWPSADLRRANPIEVQFTAGYADAAAVPVSIKHAILLLIGHWYKNREAVTVGNTASSVSAPLMMGVQSLLGAIERPVYF